MLVLNCKTRSLRYKGRKVELLSCLIEGVKPGARSSILRSSEPRLSRVHICLYVIILC